ncbi:hydrogenase maturation nickel metallochaperone HypA/HybF [Sinosporangium siamense]|uniref:Hydrogenase maturation factor HypA n=1 Tax=Sinosporangium siamense TaxID=1367973 RepID=A0A919RKC4_9ACTN|nr:hydrogenase maturation nickel metallochaperone HypA [Sinosporangium siamense]GII95436.1 hypothetical protein Ssi02_56670 [Sinosporangium siamense]
MHEFGIAEAVLDAIERRANGRPVSRAKVNAGALQRIDEGAINQAFALVAEGTNAEGAYIDLVIEPVQLTCRSCGHNSTSTDPLVSCLKCGGTDLDTEGGDGLVLESIEIAEAGHVSGNPGRDRGDSPRPA